METKLLINLKSIGVPISFENPETDSVTASGESIRMTENRQCPVVFKWTRRHLCKSTECVRVSRSNVLQFQKTIYIFRALYKVLVR